MAENSLREQIIADLAAVISAVPVISLVERRHPSFEEAGRFAVTQLPYVGIVGGLPRPMDDPHYKRGTGKPGPVRSKLSTDLFFFGHEPMNPDSRISYYLDELWRAVHADTTRSGLALSTYADPEPRAGIYHPYIAFFLTVTCIYIHDTTTI